MLFTQAEDRRVIVVSATVITTVVACLTVTMAIVALAGRPPGRVPLRAPISGTNLPASSPYLQVFATDWKHLRAREYKQQIDCGVAPNLQRCRVSLAYQEQMLLRIVADLATVAVPSRLVQVTTTLEHQLRTNRTIAPVIGSRPRA